MILLYFLFLVSVFEEIIFRGFINSRMQGLLKNKYITIIIVSLLFSLIHWPFNSMWFQGSPLEYFRVHLPYHLILSLLHFIFQNLYNKYQNLAAPILVHFVYDYIQWFFIKEVNLLV
jgi:hypothetical protein